MFQITRKYKPNWRVFYKAMPGFKNREAPQLILSDFNNNDLVHSDANRRANEQYLNG